MKREYFNRRCWEGFYEEVGEGKLDIMQEVNLYSFEGD